MEVFLIGQQLDMIGLKFMLQIMAGSGLTRHGDCSVPQISITSLYSMDIQVH